MLLIFLLYTALCFWVLFLGGAEKLESSDSLWLFDRFAASLTVQELKFYAGISWLASAVIFAVLAFS